MLLLRRPGGQSVRPTAKRLVTMPELPEVEVVRRGAGALVQWSHHCGRVSGQRACDSAARAGESDSSANSLVRRSPDCPAWQVLVHLDSGSVLAVHLGMSGQLRVHQASDSINTHLRVRIAFDDPARRVVVH